MNLDQIGLIVGAAVSLIILSYLIGDNFLYRTFTHILVGVGAAYIIVTVMFDVLGPQMVVPLLGGRTDVRFITAGVGLLGCFLISFKLWPRLASVGNVSVGYLVGVGAAVALGGALFGTLGTQVIATVVTQPSSSPGKVLLDILALGATLTTLISFGFYRVARGGVLSGVNALGRFFLSIALGATFALVYVASLSLLIDRVQAISDVLNMLFTVPKP